MTEILNCYLRNITSGIDAAIEVSGIGINVGNIPNSLIRIGRIQYGIASFGNCHSDIYLGSDKIYDFFYGANLSIHFVPLPKIY